MAKSSVRKSPDRTVNVAVSGHPYPVAIGSGIRQEFPGFLGRWGRGRAFWVTDQNVSDAWGAELDEVRRDLPADMIILPPGEDQKTLATVERLWRDFARLGVERGDTLIAFGGGVIGDIVGFAAACYLRGVAFAQMPTTLLAMVDSSVGGKTGVDLPEGKNLVGAFHQPKFVIIDVDFLSTLDKREFRAGFAEVVKTALIGNAQLFSDLKKGAQDLCFRKDANALIRVIEACVRFKAEVVARDEKEADLRRILNFGHTIGHALEALGGYQRLRHGEAVFWGTWAAVDLSASEGFLNRKAADDIFGLLQPHLEAIPRLEFSPEDVFKFLARDKKVRGGIPHFVLLEAVGKPVISGQLKKEHLRKALDGLRRRIELKVS